MNPQPIPSNATKVFIDRWSCGQECCGLAYWRVIAKTSDSRWLIELWNGRSHDYLDSTDQQESIDELREVCEFYGFPLDEITLENYWDLEGLETIFKPNGV